MNRRVPNIEGNELAGGKEARWPWDAFVQGESAEAIGRHIAASFNSFAHHQKFAFNRVVSNRRELRPLSYYLLEDDALLIFKMMFASCNTKEYDAAR